MTVGEIEETLVLSPSLPLAHPLALAMEAFRLNFWHGKRRGLSVEWLPDDEAWMGAGHKDAAPGVLSYSCSSTGRRGGERERAQKGHLVLFSRIARSRINLRPHLLHSENDFV